MWRRIASVQWWSIVPLSISDNSGASQSTTAAWTRRSCTSWVQLTDRQTAEERGSSWRACLCHPRQRQESVLLCSSAAGCTVAMILRVKRLSRWSISAHRSPARRAPARASARWRGRVRSTSFWIPNGSNCPPHIDRSSAQRAFRPRNRQRAPHRMSVFIECALRPSIRGHFDVDCSPFVSEIFRTKCQAMLSWICTTVISEYREGKWIRL